MAKPAPPNWTLETVSRNVHVVRSSAQNSRWEMWALLMSDEHWDNPDCDLALLKEHHDEARRRGAVILKAGDTFCAMGGKWDKRSDKSKLRPEHQTNRYFDALVDTAAKWYKPYVQNIAVIAQGNHETSVASHHETDLVDRLCERLRAYDGITQPGGYGGWLKFQFGYHSTKTQSYRIYYHHGFGGGGPVTMGKIDYSRYLMQVANADCIVAGHVHYKECFPVKRSHLNDANQVEQRTVQMVRCGSYKDEYRDGHGGWHVEKGRGPRPLGGYWLRFYVKGDRICAEFSEAN